MRLRRGGTQLSRVVVAATVALAMASCDSGTDDEIPQNASPTSGVSTTSSTPTASDTTTAPAADVNELIKSRYEAFWEARFSANQHPVDPNAPQLRELATGLQLENVISETAKRQQDGLAFRRPTSSVARRTVTVVEVTDDRATVQDCSVNDGVIYRVANGEVVDDDVVTESVEASLKVVDGLWKVENTRLVQRWEGVAGCAVSQ